MEVKLIVNGKTHGLVAMTATKNCHLFEIPLALSGFKQKLYVTKKGKVAQPVAAARKAAKTAKVSDHPSMVALPVKIIKAKKS